MAHHSGLYQHNIAFTVAFDTILKWFDVMQQINGRSVKSDYMETHNKIDGANLKSCTMDKKKLLSFCYN